MGVEVGSSNVTVESNDKLFAALSMIIQEVSLSCDSEFIENESEDTTKQDCELNAFYRLAKRVKETYPQF